MTPAIFAALASEHGGEAEFGLVTPVQWETYLWTLGIFVALVLILRKLAWKPLLAAVEEREKRIADSLRRAEEVQKAAAETAARQEAAMAEAHAKAKAVLDEARGQAEEYRKREIDRTRAEADAFLERAKKEIALEENRARDALRKEVVDLTLETASRVLERSVSGEDERRLAEKTVEEIRRRGVGAVRN